MQKIFGGAVAALVLFGSVQSALAGPVERACLRSGAEAANRGTCACIQNVADQTLRGADQRRAAKLMGDPDLAHDVWLSKRQADDSFWERYKAFGQMAEAYCSG